MSWIRGDLVLDDLSKKSLDKAHLHIDRRVKSNSDLVEFPNAGARFTILEVSVPEPFADKDTAEDFLNNRKDWHRKWNVAVRFYDRSRCTPTKKYLSLCERLQTEQKKLNDYVRKHDFSSFQAKLITCSVCGSKLNKDYLKGYHCPLCRNDMRSETTKNTVIRYQQKIRDIKLDIMAEEKKSSGKAVVKYLVLYEEYVG